MSCPCCYAAEQGVSLGWCLVGFVGYGTAADEASKEGPEAGRSMREEQAPIAAGRSLPFVLGVKVDRAHLRASGSWADRFMRTLFFYASLCV